MARSRNSGGDRVMIYIIAGLLFVIALPNIIGLAVAATALLFEALDHK